MTVYHRHMTQRVTTDPYWQYNCSAYSGAMLITDSTVGGISITGRRVREMSTEPIPDPGSPGLNIPQVLNVARKLLVTMYDQQGHAWNEIPGRLREDRRVLLQVDYGELGGYRCQANGDFGHALVLIKISTDGRTIAASDPLCKAPKNYPAEVLHNAARVFARATNVDTGVRWAMTRQIPRIR